MRKYKLKADAEFYAEDIDDAFKVLAQHFIELSEKDIDNVENIFSSGSVSIKRSESNAKNKT